MVYGSSLLIQIPNPTEAAEHRRDNDHRRALDAANRRAEPIAIRLLGPTDRPELERVAGVDSAGVPAGARTLGAEVEGRLVAALSLDDGNVVADPFRRSAAAVELLKLRARQLGGDKHRRRSLRHWALRRAVQTHARAGLPGSPPGDGGRLLQL